MKHTAAHLLPALLIVAAVVGFWCYVLHALASQVQR